MKNILFSIPVNHDKRWMDFRNDLWERVRTDSTKEELSALESRDSDIKRSVCIEKINAFIKSQLLKNSFSVKLTKHIVGEKEGQSVEIKDSYFKPIHLKYMFINVTSKDSGGVPLYFLDIVVNYVYGDRIGFLKRYGIQPSEMKEWLSHFFKNKYQEQLNDEGNYQYYIDLNTKETLYAKMPFKADILSIRLKNDTKVNEGKSKVKLESVSDLKSSKEVWIGNSNILELVKHIELLDEEYLDSFKGKNYYPFGVTVKISSIEKLYIPRTVEVQLIETIENVLNRKMDFTFTLIKGNPGTGKSSQLWSLKKQLKKVGVTTFLLLAENLLELVEGEMLNSNNLKIITAFQQIRKKSNFAILIDGIDLVYPRQPRFIQLLRKFLDNGICVVGTTRILEGEQLVESLKDISCPIEIHELGVYTHKEAHIALKTYASFYEQKAKSLDDKRSVKLLLKRLEVLLEQSDKNNAFSLFLKRPLFLSLIYSLYAYENKPIVVYDEFSLFQDYWRLRILEDFRGNLSLNAGNLETVVFKIARGMINRRRSYLFLNELREINVPTVEIEKLIHRGVIMKNEKNGKVEFFHQTFFTFSIAKYLSNNSCFFSDSYDFLQMDNTYFALNISKFLIPLVLQIDKENAERLLGALLSSTMLLKQYLGIDIYLTSSYYNSHTNCYLVELISQKSWRLSHFFDVFSEKFDVREHSVWSNDFLVVWKTLMDYKLMIQFLSFVKQGVIGIKNIPKEFFIQLLKILLQSFTEKIESLVAENKQKNLLIERALELIHLRLEVEFDEFRHLSVDLMRLFSKEYNFSGILKKINLICVPIGKESRQNFIDDFFQFLECERIELSSYNFFLAELQYQRIQDLKFPSIINYYKQRIRPISSTEQFNSFWTATARWLVLQKGELECLGHVSSIFNLVESYDLDEQKEFSYSFLVTYFEEADVNSSVSQEIFEKIHTIFQKRIYEKKEHGITHFFIENRGEYLIRKYKMVFIVKKIFERDSFSYADWESGILPLEVAYYCEVSQAEKVVKDKLKRYSWFQHFNKKYPIKQIEKIIRAYLPNVAAQKLFLRDSRNIWIRVTLSVILVFMILMYLLNIFIPWKIVSLILSIFLAYDCVLSNFYGIIDFSQDSPKDYAKKKLGQLIEIKVLICWNNISENALEGHKRNLFFEKKMLKELEKNILEYSFFYKGNPLLGSGWGLFAIGIYRKVTLLLNWLENDSKTPYTNKESFRALFFEKPTYPLSKDAYTIYGYNLYKEKDYRLILLHKFGVNMSLGEGAALFEETIKNSSYPVTFTYVYLQFLKDKKIKNNIEVHLNIAKLLFRLKDERFESSGYFWLTISNIVAFLFHKNELEEAKSIFIKGISKVKFFPNEWDDIFLDEEERKKEVSKSINAIHLLLKQYFSEEDWIFLFQNAYKIEASVLSNFVAILYEDYSKISSQLKRVISNLKSQLDVNTQYFIEKTNAEYNDYSILNTESQIINFLDKGQK